MTAGCFLCLCHFLFLLEHCVVTEDQVITVLLHSFTLSLSVFLLSFCLMLLLLSFSISVFFTLSLSYFLSCLFSHSLSLSLFLPSTPLLFLCLSPLFPVSPPHSLGGPCGGVLDVVGGLQPLPSILTGLLLPQRLLLPRRTDTPHPGSAGVGGGGDPENPVSAGDNCAGITMVRF